MTIGPSRALRALIGDALIAAGETVQGGAPNVDLDLPVVEVQDVHGAMECDGPLLAWSATPTPDLSNEVVRAAVDDLSDSELLRIAANIIDSYRPAGGDSILSEALRDRAAQFEAIERDAHEPFLTRQHLGAHLTAEGGRGENPNVFRTSPEFQRAYERHPSQFRDE